MIPHLAKNFPYTQTHKSTDTHTHKEDTFGCTWMYMDVPYSLLFIGLNKLHRLQAHPTQSPILANLGLWQLAEHHAESIHGAMSRRLPGALLPQLTQHNKGRSAKTSLSMSQVTVLGVRFGKPSSSFLHMIDIVTMAVTMVQTFSKTTKTLRRPVLQRGMVISKLPARPGAIQGIYAKLLGSCAQVVSA